MRFATVLFSILLAPVMAQAQAVARADSSAVVIQPVGAPQQSAETGPGMPLWGTPDGRILALVALGGNHGAPVLPQAPQIGSAVDWQLIDVTHFVGGGLSLRLGNRIDAWVKFGRGIALTPLNSAAATLGCDSGLAFALNESCPYRAASANTGTLSIGTGLSTDRLDLSVDYGYARLHRGSAPRTAVAQTPPWDLFATIGNEALPTLALPALQWADVSDNGVRAQGHWHWNDENSLDVGAALSRLRFELPGNAPLPALNQAALSFGVRSGNFSGTLTGRVLGPADSLGNGQSWTSVDLGISWRAPWRGVFSVGAQNLWSSGTPPLLADPTHATDPSQARVPYVQYHQDL